MIFSSVIWIYIVAAILPAALLMLYVYNLDSIEKEPAYILKQLTLRGVYAALAAMVIEYFGEAVLSRFISNNGPAYSITMAFLVVAVAEEGMKFIFLYKRTWRDDNFNYRFDGVVYAVFVSLGFAAFENITYVFNYGLSVAPGRAVLSIPAHMGFAVFMGTFYGNAKAAAADGRLFAKRANLLLGYISAVFLHGFYDSCAMIQTTESTVAFVVFVVVMYIIVFNLIRRDARTDRHI